jgi:hypothetical protein
MESNSRALGVMSFSDTLIPGTSFENVWTVMHFVLSLWNFWFRSVKCCTNYCVQRTENIMSKALLYLFAFVLLMAVPIGGTYLIVHQHPSSPISWAVFVLGHIATSILHLLQTKKNAPTERTFWISRVYKMMQPMLLWAVVPLFLGCMQHLLTPDGNKPWIFFDALNLSKQFVKKLTSSKLYPNDGVVRKLRVALQNENCNPYVDNLMFQYVPQGVGEILGLYTFDNAKNCSNKIVYRLTDWLSKQEATPILNTMLEKASVDDPDCLPTGEIDEVLKPFGLTHKMIDFDPNTMHLTKGQYCLKKPQNSLVELPSHGAEFAKWIYDFTESPSHSGPTDDSPEYKVYSVIAQLCKCLHSLCKHWYSVRCTGCTGSARVPCCRRMKKSSRRRMKKPSRRRMKKPSRRRMKSHGRKWTSLSKTSTLSLHART